MSRDALPDPSGTLLRFVAADEFPHHLVLRKHRSGRLAESLVDLLPDARSLREPLLVLPEELVEALKLGVIQGYVDNGHPQCHALALLMSEQGPAAAHGTIRRAGASFSHEEERLAAAPTGAPANCHGYCYRATHDLARPAGPQSAGMGPYRNGLSNGAI